MQVSDNTMWTSIFYSPYRAHYIKWAIAHTRTVRKDCPLGILIVNIKSRCSKKYADQN